MLLLLLAGPTCGTWSKPQPALISTLAGLRGMFRTPAHLPTCLCLPACVLQVDRDPLRVSILHLKEQVCVGRLAGVAAGGGWSNTVPPTTCSSPFSTCSLAGLETRCDVITMTHPSTHTTLAHHTPHHTYLPPPPPQPYNAGDDMLRATTMELISTLKELLHMHPLYNEQMRNFIQVGWWVGVQDGWWTRDPARLALCLC